MISELRAFVAGLEGSGSGGQGFQGSRLEQCYRFLGEDVKLYMEQNSFFKHRPQAGSGC